jgi:hypothetical protein
LRSISYAIKRDPHPIRRPSRSPTFSQIR